MVKISELILAMEELAPQAIAESWDNVGLLVGDAGATAGHVLVALDVTDEVVEEANVLGAQLIITHHPPIFKPLHAVNSDTALGRRLIRLIRQGTAVFTAHTNLDIAQGGTNDTLAKILELDDVEPLLPNGMGRVGTLPSSIELGKLCAMLKTRLQTSYAAYAGDAARPISRVGLCTGAAAGSPFFEAAAKLDCDAYITGDVRFHAAQAAKDLGLSLIDATHYYSEIIILEPIREHLSLRFPSLHISTSNHNGQDMILIP